LWFSVAIGKRSGEAFAECVCADDDQANPMSDASAKEIEAALADEGAEPGSSDHERLTLHVAPHGQGLIL